MGKRAIYMKIISTFTSPFDENLSDCDGPSIVNLAAP